jgi:hypothetical protein
MRSKATAPRRRAREARTEGAVAGGPEPSPCGHPLAARAIRMMNERLVTVCWACAVESGLTPLYPSDRRGTMTVSSLASDGTSRVVAGVPVPPRPAR